jgi:calcineurin-like phosphoesterase family protein
MDYFTADTHFSHTNIIKYSNRPFKTATEMNNTIINNINCVVRENDTLFHLGDFAFGQPAAIEILRLRINCNNIVLIYGNHDKEIRRSRNLQDLFVDCHELLELKYGLVLCHYAMRVWNKSHRGWGHLYGHSHGSLSDIGNRSFDVGVDCTGYKPLSINQVRAEMEKRKFVELDHHKNEI